eukprot:1074289-Amphidinium_carterae.1
MLPCRWWFCLRVLYHLPPSETKTGRPGLGYLPPRRNVGRGVYNQRKDEEHHYSVTNLQHRIHNCMRCRKPVSDSVVMVP